MLRSTLMTILTALVLTGCYVEVEEYPSYGYNTDVTDFSSTFIIRTALMPYALGANSIEMVADPDAFLTPSSRSLSRAVPIETTSTYLFDSGACDFGGSTAVEAYGETETYADAMTWVELNLTATATQCDTTSWLGLSTLNSRLVYDVSGWYDEALAEIASLEGQLNGYLRLQSSHQSVKLSALDVRIEELSATDFRVNANAGLWLDDGWDYGSASLRTLESVHWYQGDTFPHAGRVRIESGYHWVEVRFFADGVSRRDSDGYYTYLPWWEFS